MTADFVIVQGLNGVAYGLLFLLAAGLSLIFGLMDVVNLAHGSFFMLGAYIGYSAARSTQNFWVALLVAPVAVGALVLLMDEPSEGLAPLIVREIGRVIGELKQSGIATCWPNRTWQWRCRWPTAATCSTRARWSQRRRPRR